MADALGWVQVPVVPVFKGIHSKLQSELVKPAEASAKKAGEAVEKQMASGADAAAKQVSKANWRVQKSAEERQDAESKLSIEMKKHKAASIELSAAEQKLADMQKQGTATASQLAKAEADVERKRAKVETAALGVEKAERGVEKAKKESEKAAESLTAAEKLLAEANEGSTEATQKLGEAMAEADSKGQGFELSLGKVAAAGAALVGAVAAAGKAAYDIGATFDDAYDTIRVGTGAAGEDFEALQQSMRNVATESIGVGSDMGAIGTMLADVNTRLGLTGEPLEKMTSQLMQLQGMGVDADINEVSKALSGFGIEAADMPDALDELFQVSQATGLTITELSQSAVKAGPALRGFGFSMSDSAALVGQMDKAGLDADKTLQSMQRALAAFASEGRDAPEALKETIVSIEDFIKAGDDAAAIDMAAGIFGTRGAAQFVDAVKTGTLSVEDFMDATGATSDTINGLAEETADAAEKWDQLKNQAMIAIEPIAAQVFDSLVPALETTGGLVADVFEKAQEIGGWISEHSDSLSALGVTLTVLAAGLAAIALQQNIVAAGGLVSWFTKLTAVTKAQTAAQAAFNLVMNTNPIMLTVTAIAALTAGLTYFFTQTETGQRLWKRFTDSVAQGIDWIKQKVAEMGERWDQAMQSMKDAGEQMRARFHEIIDSIVSKFNEWRDNVNAVIEAIKGYFDQFSAKVRESAGDAVRHMREFPDKIGNIFADAGRWLVNAGKNMIQGLINGILSMGSKIGDAITSIMPSSIGGLIGFSGGGAVPAFAGGGLPSEPGSGLLPRIPGIPRSLRDPVIGFNRAGIPIARIEPEEFIVNREDTAKNLPLLRAINSGAKIVWQAISRGREGGPEIMGGLPAFAGGGVIQPMINIVRAKYPMLEVTSGYRPGDGGYHGAGLAVDFSNGSGNTPQMLALAQDIAATYPNSLELIYDDPRFAKTIKNGKVVGRFGEFYTLAQAGPHHHHVHWAMRTAPTRALGSGESGDGGGDKEVKKGPANLPPMKWSEHMLTQNAVRAGRAIALEFPEVKSIGGYRASDPFPDHPSGRALDVMTYANKALGDRILNWLFDHNEFFKMQYAIWQQAMWYRKGAPEPMADRGSPTQNHMDHVHAYFHPSPRVNGSEIYPNLINAGGAGKAVMEMGDANLPLEIGKGAKDEGKDVAKLAALPNIDFGTASQLASQWETDKHRDNSLREFLRRNARVYDKGGIVPKGGIMVNLDDPEVVFPKKESATLLHGMKYMPGATQALAVIAEHAPGVAAAIEKIASTDFEALGNELAATFHGRGFGSEELARAIGEEAAEKIATEIAFVGDQLRDMQDGSNMRAYMASLGPSEAVGLADQVGQIFGVTQIGSTLGGIAGGYEAMQDAAVMQVDAAKAVSQAEKNLAEARKNAAEASGDEQAAALEQVAEAELDYTKALDVVGMAAAATGQAQIGMAIEVVKAVVGIGKAIAELVARIRQSYVDAAKALASGMEVVVQWAATVHEWQQHVATLQQQLVRGLNAQREAEHALRIAAHDRLVQQTESDIAVAKARLELDKEIKRGAKIAQLKVMGLHEDWDTYLAYQALSAEGVLQEWSDQAISNLYAYESARAKAAMAELEGRIEQIKAEAAVAAAARQNARNQADLLKTQERLIRMSAEVAGVDLAEATGGSQLAKLLAQMAEVQAGIDADWKGRWGVGLGAQGRHANEYRGRLAQRDSIQSAIDEVLRETGLTLPSGPQYRQMMQQMAYVQRHGGDPLNVARTFMPKLVEAESAMLRAESLKPIWEAQDKLTDDSRAVEDFLAEIDLYESTRPLEETVKALEHTVKGLDQSAEAWAEGDEDLRGEYLRSAQVNRQVAESLGVRWQFDERYDTGNLRERIAKEETIYLDGEKMYTADQIDQLLAKVTAGSNVRYQIRSSSEVVNRRRERI